MSVSYPSNLSEILRALLGLEEVLVGLINEAIAKFPDLEAARDWFMTEFEQLFGSQFADPKAIAAAVWAELVSGAPGYDKDAVGGV